MADRPIKYVFFGTPNFAYSVLGGLIEDGFNPTALVCNPDRPVGRKKIVTPPPTKQLISTFNDVNFSGWIHTEIFQPEKFDEEFITKLKSLEPDFFVVAAYAKIIPQAVLNIPRLGTLGVHPSLLPQYRGASPIQSVILAGETETGVTIYQMDQKMDHGGIFIQKSISLEPLTTDYPTLEWRLALMSAHLLSTLIPDLITGKAVARPQDEARATFTKKFSTENGFVEYSELDAAMSGNSDKAELILRTINALNPEPGCWTIKEGKRIKLLEAKMDGTALKLITVQEEGQKPKHIK